MMLQIKKAILHLLFWTPFIAFASAALMSVITGVLILGNQALSWLKEGIWTTNPLYEVTPQFILNWIENINWLGVKKILIWFLAKLPSSLSMVFLGIFLYVWGYLISCVSASE